MISAQSDITSLENNKIDKSAIANNLTTTNSGYVLDARQGKTLDNKIENQNITVTATYGTNITVHSSVIYCSGHLVAYQFFLQPTVNKTNGNTIISFSRAFKYRHDIFAIEDKNSYGANSWALYGAANTKNLNLNIGSGNLPANSLIHVSGIYVCS